MKTLILGAGGVGGYFGARLIEAGADVSFLVREQRLQNLREHGLRIESPQGNAVLQVKAVTAESVTPDYDLIVLAPKAYDLDASLASLEKAASGRAVLLPFLNGLAHMNLLDAKYGRQRVLGGVAHINAMLTEDGAVKQLSGLHSLTVGHRAKEHEPLAREFFTLCQQSQFNSYYSENIEQDLWTKWAFLASLAASTTLCRGSVGEIVATDHGKRFVEDLYAECLAVAAAYGFAIPPSAQAKAREMLTAPGSPATASMLRDLLGGKRTEHDHVLGEMARMGDAKQIATPLIKAAHCHMQVETRALFHRAVE